MKRRGEKRRYTAMEWMKRDPFDRSKTPMPLPEGDLDEEEQEAEDYDEDEAP